MKPALFKVDMMTDDYRDHWEGICPWEKILDSLLDVFCYILINSVWG